jgi:methylase of polypeptide subunit release factors
LSTSTQHGNAAHRHDPPLMDVGAGKILGEALRRAGYTEDAIRGLLAGEAYPAEPDDAPVLDRRLPDTPFGDLVRALYLQFAIPTDELVRTLGAAAVSALEAATLAEVGAEVVPRVRILPIRGLLIASDDFQPEEDDPDYVAAYTPTTRLVDMLTVRRPVRRALDVGTGSGVHALLASRHAEHVIATDVNERALQYTQLNAALNGITNVEVRRGSLYEPVAGERFDLITSNAPYVVSPESRWVYRDAGYEGDALSEHVVHAAAEHLADDGYATLLVSWIAEDEDEPDAHPLAWTEDSECDAWILPAWNADPLEHAATWNVDLPGDDEEFGAVLDEWADYFEELGARWITEGAVLLHRRDAPEHTARVDEIEADDVEQASEQIQCAFAARAGAVREPLALAMPLTFEREVDPEAGVVAARIHLDAGTHSTLEASPDAVDAIAALDGTVPPHARPLAQELLELGALRAG